MSIQLQYCIHAHVNPGVILCAAILKAALRVLLVSCGLITRKLKGIEKIKLAWTFPRAGVTKMPVLNTKAESSGGRPYNMSALGRHSFLVYNQTCISCKMAFPLLLYVLLVDAWNQLCLASVNFHHRLVVSILLICNVLNMQPRCDFFAGQYMLTYTCRK